MRHDGNILNPDNYTWQKIGERIVCRDPDTGKMLFNSHVPVTMRQALLMGFFIGWDLSERQNENYIGWLESIFDQFRPETMPMSDGEYLELLSQIEGQPIMDMGLQDILDDMDEQEREKWEREKEARDKEVRESWLMNEEKLKQAPDYYEGSRKKKKSK